MENATNDATVVAGGIVSAMLLQGINVWSVVGNIVVIVIIGKTQGMQGFSGALMVNQAVADILIELATVALYVSSLDSQIISFRIPLRLSIFALNGVVAHTLSALSVNLYLAICKQQQFKQIMTWKRVNMYLVVSWLMNIGLVCLYLLAPDMYTINASGVVTLNLTKINCWVFSLFLVNVIAVPFSSAIVCYLKIHAFTKSPTLSTLGLNNMKKLKLSQMIHVITIIFLLTYIPVVVVVATNVKTAGARAAAAIVNYFYHACKLFIYLKFYKPFRTTAKAMCCCYCWCCCSHNRVDNVQERRVISVHTIETSINVRPTGKYSEDTNV